MNGPRAAGPRAARENPFRVRRVLALRYRLDGGWKPFLERLASLGYRGALVGPEGSGKTTLLEDLETRLETRGWRILSLRLSRERRRLGHEEWRRLELAGPGDLITVDGVEQLRWWDRRRLARLSQRAGGLVVSSHRPCHLPLLHRHLTSLPLLEALVTDLVGRERAQALRPDLVRLFAIHRGNVRECLRSLYDHWAAASSSVHHLQTQEPCLAS